MLFLKTFSLCQTTWRWQKFDRWRFLFYRLIQNVNKLQPYCMGHLLVLNYLMHLDVGSMQYNTVELAYLLKTSSTFSKCPHLASSLDFSLMRRSWYVVEDNPQCANIRSQQIPLHLSLEASSYSNDCNWCSQELTLWRNEYNYYCTTPNLLDSVNTAVCQECVKMLCTLQETHWSTIQSPRPSTTSKN